MGQFDQIGCGVTKIGQGGAYVDSFGGIDMGDWKQALALNCGKAGVEGRGRGDVLVGWPGGGGDFFPLLLQAVHGLGCLTQLDVDEVRFVLGKVP